MQRHLHLKSSQSETNISHQEYLGIALSLFIPATLIGISTHLATLWLGDLIWLKVIFVMDVALFGLASIILIDALESSHHSEQ